MIIIKERIHFSCLCNTRRNHIQFNYILFLQINSKHKILQILQGNEPIIRIRLAYTILILPFGTKTYKKIIINKNKHLN